MVSKTELLSAIPITACSLFVELTSLIPSYHTGYLTKASTAFFTKIALSKLATTHSDIVEETLPRAIMVLLLWEYIESSVFQVHSARYEIVSNLCISYGLVLTINYFSNAFFQIFVEHGRQDTEI